MPSFAAVVSLISYASGAALVVATVAAAMGWWDLVLVMARAIVLVGLTTFLLSITVFVVLAPKDDFSARATTLAVGISQVMCGTLAYLAVMPGTLLWVIARRRLAVRRTG